MDKSAPFGVDLLLPKVGEGARKTNYDYTGGELPQLIDVIIHGGAKLFVCAVGVPPKWVVDKLHAAGIVVMNMTGLPKHAQGALDVGCDIICAQGTEAGGHTGDLATSVLTPATADAVKGKLSPLTGEQVMVVAAGGIYDGRGLAMALALGAQGAWVGTRFVCALEAGASPIHQKEIISASFSDTFRTLFYTGRPLRVKVKPIVQSFETQRREEMQKMLAKGEIPFKAVEDAWRQDAGKEEEVKQMNVDRRLLMGQCAGAIKDILPAKQIIEDMVSQAAAQIKLMGTLLRPTTSKL